MNTSTTPSIDALLDQVSDVKDDFGIPFGDYVKTTRQMNAEMTKRLSSRVRTASSNYIFQLGVPQTPRELLAFANTVAVFATTGGVLDGYLNLTDKATDTTGDAEARAAGAEQARRLEDIMARSGDLAATDAPGGYL